MSFSGILNSAQARLMYWIRKGQKRKYKVSLPFRILLTIIFRKKLSWGANRILSRFTKEELNHINEEIWKASGDVHRYQTEALFKALSVLSNMKDITSKDLISPFKKQMSWKHYGEMMSMITLLEKYLLIDFKKIPTMLNDRDPSVIALLRSRLVLGK